MLPPQDRPWIIAHRGASGVLRENTPAAFREAYARGADAVELDVRRTADGELVVHHDPVLPGGRPIAAMRREQLLEAAPWVPGLDEAVAACAGMWIDVEIKNSPAEPGWDPERTIAGSTMAALRDLGVVDRVLVSSFDPGILSAAAAAAPGVPTGWLASPGADPLPLVALASQAGCFSIHPDRSSLAGPASAGVVAAAGGAGLRVIVWTVDDPGEIRRLAAAGIDGIITNRPGDARSALEDDDGGGR